MLHAYPFCCVTKGPNLEVWPSSFNHITVAQGAAAVLELPRDDLLLLQAHLVTAKMKHTWLSSVVTTSRELQLYPNYNLANSTERAYISGL